MVNAVTLNTAEAQELDGVVVAVAVDKAGDNGGTVVDVVGACFVGAVAQGGNTLETIAL